VYVCIHIYTLIGYKCKNIQEHTLWIVCMHACVYVCMLLVHVVFLFKGDLDKLRDAVSCAPRGALCMYVCMCVCMYVTCTCGFFV
jgi:hypothetical protein